MWYGAAMTRFRARLCWLLAAAVLGALAPMAPARAQQVAVIVNGEPITTYDIEQRSKLIQLTTRKTPGRQEVVDELINDKLKIQIGKRYKLEIADSQVDAAFGEMAKRMRLSAQQLAQALTQSGVDAATLKERIRADIAWAQIVRGKFQSSLQVSERDVAAAAETRSKELVGIEYTLRPILFVVPRGAGEAAVEARKREAEALRSRFENCASGVALARALRDVAVRESIVKSSADLVPALREMLEKVPVGRLTEPEVTPQGVELFALCGRRETRLDSPGKRAVQNEIYVAHFESRAKRYLHELRKAAMIEVKERDAKAAGVDAR